MSQRIWGSGAALAPESVVPVFVFRLAGERVEWDWRDGPPPWRDLETVRSVKVRALSRHIPGSPYCWTTGSHVWVESGLEMDLVRELDRRPEVVWLVSQPCRVLLSNGLRHVPDMLEVRADGDVCLWDVRPKRRQDSQFMAVTAQTQLACNRVGMGYELFDDSHPVRMGNLRWLGCYARPEALWPLDVISRAVEDGRAQTVGEVLNLFDADPRVVAGLWHLLWRGDLITDLDAAITDESPLSMGPRP